MLQPWMNPADLAPGDARSVEGDFSGLELHRIRSVGTSEFTIAYTHLWNEFGAKDELETQDILADRMEWRPEEDNHGCAFLYELLLITRGAEFAGVRDHTAIVRPGFDMAVVHMSHNLVAPDFRRTGIAGWLRSLPVETARACLSAQGLPTRTPICLVGEMEPGDGDDTARMIRLRAYEKAGYRKVDPEAVDYFQPDFRTPEKIDATGGPNPLRLDLLFRFVGAEDRNRLPAGELHEIITSLYRMYGMSFRERDMAGLWANITPLENSPKPIRLIPPTQL